MLNRLFRLDANRTTPGRELQAGLTTFAAMACILAVNPAILSASGMDRPALVTVTALSRTRAVEVERVDLNALNGRRFNSAP